MNIGQVYYDKYVDISLFTRLFQMSLFVESFFLKDHFVMIFSSSQKWNNLINDNVTCIFCVLKIKPSIKISTNKSSNFNKFIKKINKKTSTKTFILKNNLRYMYRFFILNIKLSSISINK